ncbi:hypothetical protein ACFYOV_10035 [Streptomyces sp. NPDC005931]|uniref:hypothetical protein n=1 Tax=Streptomyces sp. NPDC005931 TaxID=3364737 RepID=UPI0036C01671
MAVDRLPVPIREFTDYLRGLLGRLDPSGGWCAVFWQRDPEGMRACLDGHEVPPWDVVEALLQDLAAAHGPAAADPEARHARALHTAALTAYDALPGARDVLIDRLDVMLREQRYAAERQVDLGRLLAVATIEDEADAIRRDLAWAQDDHERATARCAELRSRMAHLDEHGSGSPSDVRAGAGAGRPSGGVVPSADGAPGSDLARDPRFPDAGTGGSAPAEGAVMGARAPYGNGGPPPAEDDDAGGFRQYGGVPSPGPRSARAAGSRARDRIAPPVEDAEAGGYGPHGVSGVASVEGPEPGGHGPYGAGGTAYPAYPASTGARPNPHVRRDAVADEPASWPSPVPPVPYAAPRRADAGAPPAAPPERDSAPRPRRYPEPGAPWPTPPVPPPPDGAPRRPHGPAEAETTPPPAPDPAPTPAPAPQQRRRRRGSARFAGMEEEATPVVVPPVATVPVAAAPAGKRAPRGARFAGADETVDEERPRAEQGVDAADRQEVVRVVRTLARLRREGRSGEAHALLAETAYSPAVRFPLLAAEMRRAGLDADWATLLWEAGSLPPARLVAAADALTAAGRTDDGESILRQGVVRPADEIGRAVLGLAAEDRRREMRALLDACVRMRTPEEAARSAAPDPQRLVPLLLDAARHVSDERHWDLVHALRVAGITA